MAKARKSDLIKVLVDEYGYEKEDVKNLTNAKLTALIKEEESDAVELEQKESELKKREEELAKREAELLARASAPVTESIAPSTNRSSHIDRSKLVQVMNGTVGTLIYTSKRTGQTWQFSDYGQTDEIEVQELITIRNAHNRMLSEPYLIILDNEVVEYLGLTEMYKNILTPSQIEGIFDLPIDKMKEIIEKCPNGLRHTITGMALKKFEEGTLSDIHKINYFQDTFNMDLGL